MPHCFQLTRKGCAEPSKLFEVDEHICAHFGWPVDKVKYTHAWFDTIGLALACGHSFNKIAKDIFTDGPLHEITLFLSREYSADAWREWR
jgi:hypothetical protein